MLLSTMLVSVNASPAAAAGVGTITKQLDATQGPGFTAPNTFLTGSLVRYRITASCSSNETDCGVGTITDALDPRLTFVNVVQPTTAVPISVAHAAGTVTIAIGTNASPWPDGNTLEFVIVARVNSDASSAIDNRATITTTDGPTNQSEIVTVTTPPPFPRWDVDKTKLVPVGNPAVGEDVTYRIQFRVPSLYGNVDVTSGVLVDRYPVGATVVSTSPAGIVDTVNHTITWNIGALPAATQQNCSNPTLGTDCRSFTQVDVVLNFPTGSTFDAGETVNNIVEFTPQYADGTSELLTDTEPITFAAPAPAIEFFKNGPSNSVENGLVTWRLYAGNRGNNTLVNAQIVDILPTGVSDLELWRQFPDFNPVTPSWGGPIVFEYFDGAMWNSWFTFNESDNWSTLSVPAGATQIRMTDSALSPNHNLNIYLRGTVEAGAVVDSTFQNCATFTADNLPSPPAQQCVTTTVIEPFTTMFIYKGHVFPDAGLSSVRPGDEFTWAVMFNMGGPSYPDTVNVSDQLPPQFEFVETTCYVHYPGNATPDSVVANGQARCGVTSERPQPVVTTVNTPVAGTSLLQWNNLTPPGATTYTNNGSYVIFFTVRVKEGTAVANYTNRAHVHTDEVNTVCVENAYRITNGPDVDDLDGDGDTTEIICSNTDPVQVREASIADISKWVKGNLDLNVAEATGLPDASCPDWDGFTRFPCVATLSPNAPFDYRFRMVNTGNITLTDYTVYDILPHVGDVGVNEALAGSPRNTDWTPVMTGPLTLESAALPGANPIVRYNLSYDPCRPEMSEPTPGVVWQVGCDDTWYTAAEIASGPGWSAVKSFRIQMYFDDGAAWQPADEIIMGAPMQAPPTAPTSTESPLDLSVAWNSVGHQVFRLNADGSTAFLPAAAPRKVGVIVPFNLVRLGNQLWYDTGAGTNTDNGVYDADELPVTDTEVELWEDTDNSGTFNPVFDTLISTTSTDSEGNYSFLVNANTAYIVAVRAGQSTLTGYLSSTGQTTGTDAASDNRDHGAPAAGYIAVSGPVVVNAGSAPENEIDTNDVLSADLEADAVTGTTIADVDSNMTIDFGFIQESIYDLAVVKLLPVVPTAPVAVGDEAVYTITVRNQGSIPSGAFSLTDLLPVGMEYVSDTAPAAVTVTDLGATVTIDVPGSESLDPGEELSFTMTLAITDASYTAYRNDVEITTDSGDDVDSTPGSGDNGSGDTDWAQDDTATNHNDATTNTDGPGGAIDDHDAEEFINTPIYDLAVVKLLPVLPTAPVAVGDEAVYTITVRNQGSIPSGAFSLTDLLPVGMEYVSDTSSGDVVVTDQGATVTIDVPGSESLDPGEELTFTMTLAITDASYTAYRNDVEITSDSGDDVDSTPGSGDNGSGDTDWAQDDTATNHNDATTNTDGPGGAFDDHDAEEFYNTPLPTENLSDELSNTGMSAGVPYAIAGAALLFVAGLMFMMIARRRRDGEATFSER